VPVMTIDRTTPMEDLLSLMEAIRLIAVKRGHAALLTSDVIDPDDYDNETDYINAASGMREKIIEGLNTPLSGCVDVPEDWIRRRLIV